MNPLQNSPGVNSIIDSWAPTQNLEPESINEKKWAQEYEGHSSDEELTWSNTTLSIPLKYGGGRQHQFKAYILDTSSTEEKSFTILLEDLVKDDDCEGLILSVINLDLAKYSESGTKFKVMTLGWGNSAHKVGESAVQ